MKRFISYLLLCCSIFLAVFVSFDKVFFNVNTGSDFGNSKEFIYQINLKNEEDTYINGDDYMTKEDFDNNHAIDDVVEEMKKRLDIADVTNAVVEKLESKEENDNIYTIRVAYKAQYEQLYDVINDFLLFDRNLSVSIIQDSFNFPQYTDNDVNKSQLFELGKAEVDNSGALPIIKLPLADPQKFNDEVFKIVVGEAEDEQNANHPIFKAGEVVAPDAPTEGEGEGEPEPEIDQFVYVVNNWKERYTLKDALEKDKYYTEAKNSIIYKFNTKAPETMFYKYDASSTENKYLMLDYTQYTPEGLDQITDRAALQRIIHTCADIEAAKFNSTPYKLDVVKINEHYAQGTSQSSQLPPFVEAIREYGKLTVSSLLIATITAFLLTALFMALNYGLNAVTGLAAGSVVTLLSAGMLSLFGVEFNLGTIVALIIVAAASIFSSCIYFKSIRESCYEGKNLKKATTEANKKTLMYHVDISAILVILGIVGYVMDNSFIMSMGAIFICGGIFNFLISLIVLRGLTWLLTNSSFIDKHIGVLKIEKRLIPDLLNDEKPTYFESFKQIKSNKTRNIIVASVAGALLLGSIIAIPVVNSVTGDIYGKAPETAMNSEIYIQYTVGDSDTARKGFATPEEFKSNILDKIYTIETKDDKAVKGDVIKYSNVKSMYYENVINDKGDTEIKFTYIIEFKDNYTKEAAFDFLPKEDSVAQEGKTLTLALQEAIDAVNTKEVSANPTIYLMNASNLSDDTLNYNVLIFTLIGVAVSTAYILLRFGLGKALISLIAVGGTSTMAVGVFSMLQVGLSSANTLAVVIITVIGYAILLHYFGRERDIIKTNKSKIRDLETRDEYLRISSNLSFSTTLTALALGFLVIIAFLLSKAFPQGIVLISALGILFLILFAQALYLPMNHINKICWNKSKEIVNFEGFGKKKGEKAKAKKSDGPQEAIIPGIND